MFSLLAEVPFPLFRPARQLSECKGKGASASREVNVWLENVFVDCSAYFT